MLFYHVGRRIVNGVCLVENDRLDSCWASIETEFGHGLTRLEMGRKVVAFPFFQLFPHCFSAAVILSVIIVLHPWLEPSY